MCWYNRKKRQHTRPKPSVTAAEVSSDLSLSHELDKSGSAAVLGVEDHKVEPTGDNFDHQTPKRVISPSAVHSGVHVTREPAEPAPSVPTTGEHEPIVLLGDEVERKANDTHCWCQPSRTIRRLLLTRHRSPKGLTMRLTLRRI
jgi:hypothetical protein